MGCGISSMPHFLLSDSPELAIMKYGTQPILTAGSGNYPIVLAAMSAVQQMCQ